MLQNKNINLIFITCIKKLNEICIKNDDLSDKLLDDFNFNHQSLLYIFSLKRG